jgi:glycosyltransferase involved in cell wall biosynthesis
MAKLFIGLPVYNSEAFLNEAVRSIQSQSFNDWEMLIADNASTDNSYDIAQSLAKQDSRICTTRHSANVGALANFQHVLSHSSSDRFMWLAADDKWCEGALKECFDRSVMTERALSFGVVANVAPDGHLVRTMRSLAAFNDEASARLVYRYVLQPESFGKANLIYGIGHTQLFRDHFSLLSDAWGSDMVFVLGILSVGGAAISSDVCFHKRLSEKEHASVRATLSLGPLPIWKMSCSEALLADFGRRMRTAPVSVAHRLAATFAVIRKKQLCRRSRLDTARV